jgi:hypothetical protein
MLGSTTDPDIPRHLQRRGISFGNKFNVMSGGETWKIRKKQL